MILKEAIEKAEESNEIKALKSKGFFAVSCVGISKYPELPKDWIISYYNPDEAHHESITTCTVNDEGIIVGETSEPVKKPENKLNFEKVKIWNKESYDVAHAEYLKSNGKASQLIITLQQAENVFWAINFITLDLKVTSIKIDAINGKIIEKKEASLIHKA